MLSRLLAQAVDRARWAVLVAVAVLAGAVGGVWAVTAAGPDSVRVSTVAGDASSGARKSSEPERSDKPEKSPKPEKSDPSRQGRGAGQDKPAKPQATKGEPTAGERGVHGACVSAVARSDATGGPRDNHGGAVSVAAHTCPHPTPNSSAGTAP
jgi:hypothetical protein